MYKEHFKLKNFNWFNGTKLQNKLTFDFSRPLSSDVKSLAFFPGFSIKSSHLLLFTSSCKKLSSLIFFFSVGLIPFKL